MESRIPFGITVFMFDVDCVWNVMAHAQKPDLVFRRNGRVRLNRWGRQLSTTSSRGVRISGSNAGYIMFRGSVKGTGYPLHSPVSPSLPLPCVTVCHHISTGLYSMATVLKPWSIHELQVKIFISTTALPLLTLSPLFHQTSHCTLKHAEKHSGQKCYVLWAWSYNLAYPDNTVTVNLITNSHFLKGDRTEGDSQAVKTKAAHQP
jgi:hypothetical protein